MKSFREKSYDLQSKGFDTYVKEGKKVDVAKSWFKEETVDRWRVNRMYETVDPILESDRNASWLTVGDGRFGLDACYIMRKGSKALPTDISDTLLKESKEKGLIDEYSVENAEALSFNDESFDYVYCKDAYHHFPRPMIALYEMLRVANKGVFLMEPNDVYLPSNISAMFFRNMLSILKKKLNGKYFKFDFELSGNFVYFISRREIEKTAVAMNYRAVAFKNLNDAYYKGGEHENLSENGPIQKKTKRMIRFRNFLCSIKMLDYTLLAAVIFKKEPSKITIDRLKNDGYDVIMLPFNPYIK